MGLPSELHRQVEEMYWLGIYDQTERLIKKYIEKNGDSISDGDKKYLEYFLEFEKKMRDKKTRVIVTTHTRLSTLEDDFLKDFVVIVDEDILVSSFFMHTRDILSGMFSNFINRGRCPENVRNFLTQILNAEDNKVYTVDHSNVGR